MLASSVLVHLVSLVLRLQDEDQGFLVSYSAHGGIVAPSRGCYVFQGLFTSTVVWRRKQEQLRKCSSGKAAGGFGYAVRKMSQHFW